MKSGPTVISDMITSIAALSLASAAIGAVLTYTRDQWRLDHPKHHDRRH